MAEMDTGSTGGSGGDDDAVARVVAATLAVVNSSVSTVSDTASNSWSSIQGVPDVLRNLDSDTKSLLQDPRTFILVVVYEALVGGILDAAASVIGLLLEAGTLAASVFPMALNALMNALGGVTGALGGLLEAFLGALGPIIVALGPFGPLLAIVVLYSISKVAGPTLEALLGLISPRLLAVWKALSPIIPYVGGR